MKKDLFDLTGQIGVVIGATGVLGGAISQALARAGASVAVLGRNTEHGQARVAAIRELGGTADFFLADALDRDSLRGAKEKIIQQWGTPTILVNAAGGNDPKVTVTGDLPFEKIPTEDWRTSFDLNLTAGALLPCQEIGSAMKDAGQGSIINIASICRGWWRTLLPNRRCST
jgi:NAD(P)-dependent dehydrogenase (short-subunit alcohol dehydrogenase family)